jgi:hypothetical protein
MRTTYTSAVSWTSVTGLERRSLLKLEITTNENRSSLQEKNKLERHKAIRENI